MERREAPGCLRGTLGEPCEGPPRALRGRAHPNDVGVRRLPALHLRRSRRDHVLPAPVRVAADPPGDLQEFLGESAYMFMICSFHVHVNRVGASA